MIKVFYGSDRSRATTEAKKILGDHYEVVEGVDLEPHDLPSIFMGNSLFSEKRQILIRDLFANKSVAEKITEYLNTPHDIIILEFKIAKNSAFYKNLYQKIEFHEFKIPEVNHYRVAIDIYNTAKKDGQKAVSMLAKIQNNEDPISFAGMIISVALKEFALRQGSKEKRALKELSKLDLKIKSTSFSPWTLISSFLLQLSSWQ